jgi:hypothetical protein
MSCVLARISRGVKMDKLMAPSFPSVAVCSTPIGTIIMMSPMEIVAAKPSTTGVDVELTDKEKRAKNKKIRAEVLQKMPQIKAELGVPNAFGTEH